MKPPFLNAGDRVEIVAPGARLQSSELEVALKTIGAWQLEVSLGQNVLNATHSYLSGTDQQRLSDIQRALNDPEIKAIFCARGGYGTTRILDSIDFTEFKKKPKWIVGFSDITALHLALEHIGFESIHGIMPLLFGRPDTETSIESLRKVLFGEEVALQSKGNQLSKPGVSEGRVIGGNLSLVVDSLGTRYELNTEGKILLLEEVEEYRYKVDRMLIQLKRAGKFDSLSGLIVGYMTDIRETGVPFGEELEEIVLDKVAEFDFPVAFGFPIGHDNPNIAWRHGALMELGVKPPSATLRPITRV